VCVCACVRARARVSLLFPQAFSCRLNLGPHAFLHQNVVPACSPCVSNDLLRKGFHCLFSRIRYVQRQASGISGTLFKCRSGYNQSSILTEVFAWFFPVPAGDWQDSRLPTFLFQFTVYIIRSKIISGISTESLYNMLSKLTTPLPLYAFIM